MNIGIDGHMIGHNETGNETYIVELVRALATQPSGDYFTLYVERPEAVPSPLLHAPHIRVVPLETRSSAQRLLWELPHRAARDRLDVLHISYNAPLRLPNGCALVVTVHDISFEHFPQFFSRRLRAMLKASVPRSARAAQQVITVAEFIRRDLIQTYKLSPDKVVVTPEAAGSQYHRIEDAAALQAVRARYETGERFVLAVGNLQPRKNWERLIRAFARAKQESGLPHKLVIVGQRLWRHTAILEAARASADVVLTGYVPAEDLPLLYNAAEAFAYPSLYEGFGLPVLEAMACGAPVITSNVSALPEIAGDAAHLVNPYREDELAAALVRLMGDEAYRAELRRRGLHRAQSFSWGRTASQTLEIYHSAVLLKRAASHPALA